MPTLKYLTLLSYEWLAPTGDASKLLVRYSVREQEDIDDPSLARGSQSIVLILSGSAESNWREPAELLESRLLEFARLTLTKAIESGKPPEESVKILSDQIPPSPKTIKTAIGVSEPVLIRRDLGFKSSRK